MSLAILSLGSSLGEKEATLKSALFDLQTIGTILASSSFYSTQPEGDAAKNIFVNCCVKIETQLSPQELLLACQSIENRHGRTRIKKWEDRTLDIDIITYDNLIIDEPNLKIPHPLAQQRDFVMVPLRDILSNKELQTFIKSKAST